jgi:PhzF family phenazine biosynthesis protein
MPLDLWLVDAFTDTPFAGNPAAVCLLDGPRPEAWMRSLAREMNQAETAFLLRAEAGFDLRWFTPAVEVDLCGHATLASAHFLWEEHHLKPRATAQFNTRSGVLTARREAGWITLDFPSLTPQPAEAPAGLCEAVGATGGTVFRSRFDYLIVLDDAKALRALAPDFQRLKGVEARGVIVTAPSDLPGVDFISRFFAPAVGVNEDPVTGSAHCVLTPYWTARLGRNSLVGYQASARGGTVRVEQAGDRVRLGGQAVTTVKGMLEA